MAEIPTQLMDIPTTYLKPYNHDEAVVRLGSCMRLPSNSSKVRPQRTEPMIFHPRRRSDGSQSRRIRARSNER